MRGHDAQIITATPGPAKDNGTAVHRLPVSRIPRWHTVWNWRALRILQQRLLHGRFDVVHGHSLYSPLPWRPRPRRRLGRHPQGESRREGVGQGTIDQGRTGAIREATHPRPVDAPVAVHRDRPTAESTCPTGTAPCRSFLWGSRLEWHAPGGLCKGTVVHDGRLTVRSSRPLRTREVNRPHGAVRDHGLSFAKTPSGNAALRVRLGGLVARGTARCRSRKRSRHAGFAPGVRPLGTEASGEQRPIHRAGTSPHNVG
jgi:hypothetical protein